MVFFNIMSENIFFIGTSHIASDSIISINKILNQRRPDIVAIELDKKRLHALLSDKKQGLSVRDISRIGFKGWLFAVFGQWIQKKLGQKVGIMPGSDMLSAYKFAVKNKVQVALVDQDIEKTLRKFSKSISWKERWNFVVDIFRGFFSKKKIKFDLSKVPEEEMIDLLISELEKRYPNVHKVLIDERNSVIAKNICKLSKKFPDSTIAVVLGAGHVKEVKRLVKKYLKECDFI